MMEQNNRAQYKNAMSFHFIPMYNYTATLQDTIGGVFQIVGSFGERCQCDNSTGAGACPVGRDIDQVCSGECWERYRPSLQW